MSEKQAKTISFIGGLIFFSVVVGVLLIKNDKIRAEAESQAMSLLKTTKGAVSQIQFVVSKVGKITGENKLANQASNYSETPTIDGASGYDALWGAAKTQN